MTQRGRGFHLINKRPWPGASGHRVEKFFDPSLGKCIAVGLRKDEHVPAVVIEQQETAPTKETNNMTYDEQELCLKAERLIREGNLDAATDAVRQFERVVKARHKVVVTHDDNSADEDWSEAATAPDGDGEDPSSDDDSSDDEEDDGIPMKTRKGHQGSYNLMDRGPQQHGGAPVLCACRQPSRHKHNPNDAATKET
jgi:hypothetical protein